MAVNGIQEKSILVKTKDLTRETISTRKLINIDCLFKLQVDSNVTVLCTLGWNNMQFRSFIFYLAEVIELMQETSTKT